ncbi:MAG: sigma-70 family RNA polymerase sigma factor [Labilithrix sp.]|nr:sigma-70 family RNA polymerase sigma factor [Labilithrix sp.]
MTAVVRDEEFPSALRSYPVPRMDRLAALFEAHAAFVARALRRLGIPDRDVDDGLQEVFLIAQSKLDVIEPGKERAFLLGVARRRASTLRRSLDRAARRSEQPLDWVKTTENPPDSVERTEQEHARAMLDEVLDALPLDLRTVLVLHELEEMDIPEIAELLGIPVGTAASRLRRAREKFEVQAERMRARLAREGEG